MNVVAGVVNRLKIVCVSAAYQLTIIIAENMPVALPVILLVILPVTLVLQQPEHGVEVAMYGLSSVAHALCPNSSALR